ncbi:amidohydrolase family protein [Amycolatopsis lurida]
MRDPAVTPQEWHTLVQAQAAGRLSVRSHAMIFSTPAAIKAAGSMDAYIDGLEAQGIRPGAGAGRLRLWGLKLVLDGGVEAAALEQPYADRPGFRGELMWDSEELAQALATAVRRGWPTGTHAFGDRAVALMLDVARTVGKQTGPLPPGMLVIEHGGLMGDRIADAAELGVHITVQQALLDGLRRRLWSVPRNSLTPKPEPVERQVLVLRGGYCPGGLFELVSARVSSCPALPAVPISTS